MIYVMSDIHGEFKKYTEMLEKIKLCDSDTLYVLGDCVDRGPDPERVLFNMYMRRNVRPVMGNHELMALKAMEPFMSEDNYEGFDLELKGSRREYFHFWIRHGGYTTFRSFEALSKDRRETLWRYMKSFRPYELLAGPEGRTFILTHAGLGNYYEGKPLTEYTVSELACDRPVFGRKYYDDTVTVIAGHTPTLSINGKAEIFTSENLKIIDCGATFGGALACLCLDTMEEFYV